jgi:hypothetical protein
MKRIIVSVGNHGVQVDDTPLNRVVLQVTAEMNQDCDIVRELDIASEVSRRLSEENPEHVRLAVRAISERLFGFDQPAEVLSARLGELL